MGHALVIAVTMFAAGVYGYSLRPVAAGDADDWVTRGMSGVLMAFVIGAPLSLLTVFAYSLVAGPV